MVNQCLFFNSFLANTRVKMPTVEKKIDQEKIKSLRNKIPDHADENFIQKAFISMLGIEIFKEYLEEKDIEISPEPALHLNPAVLKKFDIADIRLKNNVKIDIRTIVGEEYPQMCIPREHFLEKLQPDIYVGIKIYKNLKKAELIGFIKTENISQTKGNKHYFTVNIEELNPVNDIEKAISSIQKKEKTFLALDHEKATNLFIPFIDGSISKKDQDYLLEHILDCTECRKQFNNINKLDSALKNEKDKILLDPDYSLRLFTNDPVLAKEEEVEINIREDQEEIILQEQPRPKPKNTPTPRDWADALAANLTNGEKEEKKEEISFLAEDNLAETDLKKEELQEHTLSEQNLGDIDFSDESKDNPPDNPPDDSLKEPKEEAEPEEKDEEPISKKPVKETDEVENILDTLNEVEILQGEEDIDNILSFFDHETNYEETSKQKKEVPEIAESKIIEKPAEPAEPEKPAEPPPSEPEIEPPPKKERGDIKIKKNDKLTYTSVIEAKDESLENVDFLVEEDVSTAEVIRQEDLMHIFDTEIPHHKAETTPSKEDKKIILKSLLEDKSVIAFTVAVTLSTTVLFLYLGQINKQVHIANTSQNVTNINQPGNTTNNNLITKRQREPLKTYTREIVKVIKPEKIVEPEKIINLEEMQGFENNDKVVKKAVVPKVQQIKIKNISWELPADAVRDEKIKEYFLQVGQHLKTKFSENLKMPETDVKNSRISIYTELSPTGNIITSKITESSGVEKIDNICLHTLNKTLSESKLPGSSLKQDKIKFLLLIRI